MDWNEYYGTDPCTLVDFDIDPGNIEDPDEEDDEDQIDWTDEDHDTEYYGDHPDHHYH